MKSNLKIFAILVIVTVFTFLLWKMEEGASGDLSSEVTTDFAIADTSLVTKIFIAGTDGESALLERSSDTRFWTLNGKHLARKDATDLLLKTFARAEVKGAVPELQRSTVIRNFSGSGKKVEIYIGDDKLEKTWYIGTATPSHTGTYMLLETPENGKSQEPFVVHLEGFVGFLSTRFFTNETEWRYTGVFDFPGRTLAEVKITDHESPSKSYSIKSTVDGEISLFNVSGDLVDFTDTLRIQDKFLKFRKVHFESFNNHLSQSLEDSIKFTLPCFTYEVSGFDGRSAHFDVFWKSPGTGMGGPDDHNHDGEHMYGLTADGELVLVQRYVFDPLMEPLFRE